MTIYDIADALSLSPATVSLALNDDNRVALRTREKVQRYSAAHGFERNQQARNFRLKRSNNVAIVVFNIDNDFWYGFVRAVELGLGEAYNVIICNSEADAEKERKIFRNLTQRHVDGIIVQPVPGDDTHLVTAARSGIPVVLLEETEREELSFVKGNDFLAARRVTAQCIQAGHRRIAFLSFRLDCLGLDERIRGFRSATEEAGIGDACEVLIADTLDYPTVASLFDRRETDFSLVICSDDRLACHLLRSFNERHIAIPEAISMIGWNNSRYLDYMTPPLSSVRVPTREIGQTAAGIILSQLNGQQTAVKTYVQEELVQRQSFRSQ